jgi:hypothetical protein
MHLRGVASVHLSIGGSRPCLYLQPFETPRFRRSIVKAKKQQKHLRDNERLNKMPVIGLEAWKSGSSSNLPMKAHAASPGPYAACPEPAFLDGTKPCTESRV